MSISVKSSGKIIMEIQKEVFTPKTFTSPKRLFFITVASIFMAEALLMLVFSSFGALSIFEGALLDASVLTAVLLPILYVFFFRSLKYHISERARIEAEQKETLIQLKKASDDLATANKEIETFTYSVAHDLRSPLQLIDGFCLLLMKKQMSKFDKDDQDKLLRIKRTIDHMNELVEDLLNLYSIMRAELNYGSVNLSILADSIALDLKEHAHERQVEFRIEKGLSVIGDERLLRTVLENLLGNAWKFTSKIPFARIEFGMSATEDGRAIFYVRDNGVGFEPKYSEKLFEPFQRFHPAAEYPGTGIGLATVKRIIERHKGRIWAEGEPGRGSIFYFTLEREPNKNVHSF